MQNKAEVIQIARGNESEDMWHDVREVARGLEHVSATLDAHTEMLKHIIRMVTVLGVGMLALVATVVGLYFLGGRERDVTQYTLSDKRI